MPLVTAKKMLDDANAGGYAIPAIDAVDYASAEAIVSAAESLSKSIIVMVPESLFHMIKPAVFYPFLIDLARRSSVTVAIQLDHGKTLEGIMTTIHYGFSSVMIDASSLPYNENVAITKKMTELSHAAGVSIEAEIGHVTGHEGNTDGAVADESSLTVPSQAQSFVEETGVDALAVSIGNVHGLYKGTPNLDFERLREIKKLVSVPLVLHGSSGLSDDDLKNAIKGGINKINIFTEVSTAAAEAAIEYSRGERIVHFARMIDAGAKRVSVMVAKYLEMFG